MKIRAGYDIGYDCLGPTPMLLVLSIRPERLPDLLTPQIMAVTPDVPVSVYHDQFGNTCHRLLAPGGPIRFSADFTISDSGEPDVVVLDAEQHGIEHLPDDTLLFLLASRYCETDVLMDVAWQEFGRVQGGWRRVQAIVDYVNDRIQFGYHHARLDRTANSAHVDRLGVCRDYAHLAIALCRCMNIPARYCTGYLGDIGVPLVPPMDFSAWMEVFIGGRWYIFDPRNNRPRIGRILQGYGRDATDVAISTSFGAALLTKFEVVADEV
ncbi:transglutaminase family protein [Caulobacter sp. S45]|uniref:transglutaminase-like domain-containing protein n=1 Tax=Caulobacter sp. S45 TaxID=1641861 RepID=UPI00131CCD48|nr:transglutaminase family protein [Caulobacter sp. S45]